MVNSGEALLNVVTKDKRKMLKRLDQKGTWSGPEAPNSSGAVVAPPAERRDLTHTVTVTERGKPVVSPSGKAALARGADETVGKGGGSKRRPFCNGADRGCAARQHHPTVKAGRLPSGVGVRER